MVLRGRASRHDWRGYRCVGGAPGGPKTDLPYHLQRGRQVAASKTRPARHLPGEDRLAVPAVDSTPTPLAVANDRPSRPNSLSPRSYIMSAESSIGHNGSLSAKQRSEMKSYVERIENLEVTKRETA